MQAMLHGCPNLAKIDEEQPIKFCNWHSASSPEAHSAALENSTKVYKNAAKAFAHKTITNMSSALYQEVPALLPFSYTGEV